MGATADAQAGAGSLEREWWLRTLLVLQRPRPVFAALRDDSEAAAGARQEPVLALVFLAGIASVLASGTAGRLRDNASQDFDALLIAVWAIVGGGMYGVFSYFAVGVLVLLVLRLLGSGATYRQARHVLALAAAPVALWFLAVWPVQLAYFGRDLFRSGGDDTGTAASVFDAVGAAFLLWALALLVVGILTLRTYVPPPRVVARPRRPNP